MDAQTPPEAGTSQQAPRDPGASSQVQFFQPTGSMPPPRPAKRRWGRIAIGALALVLAVAVLVIALRPESMFSVPELRVETQGTVAVLPFVNATGDRAQAWVQYGLAPMIAEVVAVTPELEVVPPAELRDALLRRGLDLATDHGRTRAREVAMALGAAVLLETRVERGRDGYRLSATLSAAADPKERVEEVFKGDTVLAAADLLVTGVVHGLAPDALRPTFDRSFSGSAFFDRLYGIGRHVLATEGPEQAEPYFAIALELQPRFLAARRGLAACARSSGDLVRAQALGLEILEQAQGRGDNELQAETLVELAEIAALEGRVTEAEELHLQAQSRLSALGDRRAQARVQAARARLALSERQPARSESLFLEALQHNEAVGDHLGRAGTLLEVGSLRLAAGDLDGAQALLGDARDVGRQIGDTEIAMTATASLGEIAAQQGSWEEADALWAEVLAHDRQRADRGRAIVLARRRADLAVTRGDMTEAEELYSGVLDMAVAVGDVRAEGRAALALASILVAKGYRYQARPHLDRALELDREIDDPAGIQRLLARFAYEGGDFRMAVEGQRALANMSDSGWSEHDAGLLAAYELALATGERQSLPSAQP